MILVLVSIVLEVLMQQNKKNKRIESGERRDKDEISKILNV